MGFLWSQISDKDIKRGRIFCCVVCNFFRCPLFACLPWDVVAYDSVPWTEYNSFPFTGVTRPFGIILQAIPEPVICLGCFLTVCPTQMGTLWEWQFIPFSTIFYKAWRPWSKDQNHQGIFHWTMFNILLCMWKLCSKLIAVCLVSSKLG